MSNKENIENLSDNEQVEEEENVPESYPIEVNGKEFKMKKGRLMSTAVAKKKLPYVLIQYRTPDIKDKFLKINLNNQKISKISEIKGLESNTDLQVLNLSYNNIHEIEGLEKLTNLRVLWLKNNIIREIKGLENLTELRVLNLSQNRISEIKGLEKLTNLQILNLSENQITEVKGLDKLKGLVYLNLYKNPVYKWEKGKFGGVKPTYEYKYPQSLVKFCRESLGPSDEKVNDSENLQVLRGGDWKIKGNQSIFNYKVKIVNNSIYVITNIQIILTSIPRSLNVEQDRCKIDILNPNSFESPSFQFIARESCVGDSISGIVLYNDQTGVQQTLQIPPFDIKYVCNLLTPKNISVEDFNKKMQTMEKKEIIINSNLDSSMLEEKMKEIITKCNFSLLQQINEKQNYDLKILEGYAQGLYDKQDVALSIALKKSEEGTDLIINALSDKSEKLTDILKDVSIQLDDIKSDTELIKEYTSQIDIIFERIDDLESFLITRLASDWEKIKYAWENYKKGEIERKEFIMIGIKILGKKFIKTAISKLVAI